MGDCRGQARAARELLRLAAQRLDLEAPAARAGDPGAALGSLGSLAALLSRQLEVREKLPSAAADQRMSLPRMRTASQCTPTPEEGLLCMCDTRVFCRPLAPETC